jgi:uncharacterized membrane protein
MDPMSFLFSLLRTLPAQELSLIMCVKFLSVLLSELRQSHISRVCVLKLNIIVSVLCEIACFHKVIFCEKKNLIDVYGYHLAVFFTLVVCYFFTFEWCIVNRYSCFYFICNCLRNGSLGKHFFFQILHNFKSQPKPIQSFFSHPRTPNPAHTPLPILFSSSLR